QRQPPTAMVIPRPYRPDHPPTTPTELTKRSVAPCTELVYSPKQIDREISWVGRLDRGKETMVGKVLAVAEVQYAVFTDRDGKSWKRTAKTLTPVSR
ncbi:hypothetical protein AB0D16_35995, partial [Streptomyces sp. NPDC048161]|uniref:hypothetical protein n=1 Tax=Streptomyces sp. NPDC048161 TaxID=3160985 RepID=UPI0034108E90